MTLLAYNVTRDASKVTAFAYTEAVFALGVSANARTSGARLSNEAEQDSFFPVSQVSHSRS